MNQLKVSTRLALLTVVLVLLMVAIGLLGLFGISRANDELRSVYEDRTVPAVQLSEVDQLMLRTRLDLEHVALLPSADGRGKLQQTVQGNLDRLESLWKDYMATTLTDEEKVLAQAVVEARRRFEAEALRPLLAALLAERSDEVRRLLAEVMPARSQTLDVALDKLLELQATEAKRSYELAVQHYQQVRLYVVGGIVLGMLFAAGLSVLIVRGLRAELGAEPAEAARVAQLVAAGDLGTPVVLARGDSSSLMAQLARMQGSLAELVGQVRQTADGLATASTQIAQGNADLSSRTEEQASALEETAASMEQLQATVRQNADNARLADERAREAAGVAERGGQAVEQVVQTMRDIHTQSQRIADIIGTIDGIAFQTNILALNAAVEAARAGEQGRGFAVVATEVRSLAQRSADAAREIKSLITSSVERVQAGSTLVENAGRTIGEVVQAVGRVSTIVGEISAASAEQAAGVNQVNEAVSQMDQTTQQNAALVEESAAAAESLRQQAYGLVASVKVFVLDRTAKAAPAVTAAEPAAPRPAAAPMRLQPAAAAEGWTSF